MTTALAHREPEPEEKVYRCDNCGRRVHRYSRRSIETGWDGKSVKDDSCVYCWPSSKMRDAITEFWRVKI